MLHNDKGKKPKPSPFFFFEYLLFLFSNLLMNSAGSISVLNLVRKYVAPLGVRPVNLLPTNLSSSQHSALFLEEVLFGGVLNVKFSFIIMLDDLWKKCENSCKNIITIAALRLFSISVSINERTIKLLQSVFPN